MISTFKRINSDLDFPVNLLNSAQANELYEIGLTTTLTSGTIILEEGSICSNIYFLTKGRIKVYKILPDGKQITLYNVLKNEMCLFSLSCILDHAQLNAIAQVEEDSEILMLPTDFFKKLMNDNDQFRNMVLSRMLNSLSTILNIVEQLTSYSLTKRISLFLLEKLTYSLQTDSSMAVLITHEEIALNLGTAREVVSRVLKEMQSMKIVELNRGVIKIVNLSALKILCE